MSDINRVILKGRIGSDLELKSSAQGTSYLRMSLATNSFRAAKGEEPKEKTTHWHNVVVFGAQAEACASHLRKGSEVLVEGSIEVRTYTDREGKKVTHRNIIARSVQFLGGHRKVDVEEETAVAG